MIEISFLIDKFVHIFAYYDLLVPCPLNKSSEWGKMFRLIHMGKTGTTLVRFSVLNQTLKASTTAHPTTTTHGGHQPASHGFDRLDAYPRIGNREIVGFGRNGQPFYLDAPDVPCPAVRWREDTDEIKRLREKAKGDWAALTIDEKKKRMPYFTHPVVFSTIFNLSLSLLSLQSWLLSNIERSNRAWRWMEVHLWCPFSVDGRIHLVLLLFRQY